MNVLPRMYQFLRKCEIKELTWPFSGNRDRDGSFVDEPRDAFQASRAPLECHPNDRKVVPILFRNRLHFLSQTNNLRVECMAKKTLVRMLIPRTYVTNGCA